MNLCNRSEISTNKKRVWKPNSFVSVIISWCTVEYVKITLADDPEGDIKEIRELLNDTSLKITIDFTSVADLKDKDD